MKFEKAKEVQAQKNISKKKILEKDEFIYSRLNTWTIFNNVSICIMNPEMKGHFSFLNELVNDGIHIMPWTIKITFIKGKWSIYIGHNSNVIPDITYKDSIDKEKYDVSYFKNYLIISNIQDRIEVENIINKMIDMMKDSKLEIIESANINVKYTCEVKKGKFSISDEYLHSTEFDEGTYKKFLMMLDKLNQSSIDGDDKKIFHNIGLKLIRNKYLDKSDREILNNLFRKYMNNKDRIKIAMKFL